MSKKGQIPWNKGMKFPYKPKFSLRGRGTWNKGKRGLQVNWNKGKKRILKPEVIEKLSNLVKGEKSRWWKGGISIGKNKKEYYRIKCNERKARIKGANGVYSLLDWERLKKIFNYECRLCGKKEPEIFLTTDHIIPISRKGSNFINNIQPLCRSCNAKKGNKLMNFGLPRINYLFYL